MDRSSGQSDSSVFIVPGILVALLSFCCVFYRIYLFLVRISSEFPTNRAGRKGTTSTNGKGCTLLASTTLHASARSRRRNQVFCLEFGLRRKSAQEVFGTGTFSEHLPKSPIDIVVPDVTSYCILRRFSWCVCLACALTFLTADGIFSFRFLI